MVELLLRLRHTHLEMNVTRNGIEITVDYHEAAKTNPSALNPCVNRQVHEYLTKG